MPKKQKSIRLNEDQLKMLKELADYMGIPENDVIRHLIKKEYMNMKKQSVVTAN